MPNKTTAPLDLIDRIMTYESGEMDDGEAIGLFQVLVDTGLAWHLQGHYGRVAHALISAGVVHLPTGGEH